MECDEILGSNTFYRHQHFIENYTEPYCVVPSSYEPCGESSPGSLCFHERSSLPYPGACPIRNLDTIARSQRSIVFLCKICDVVDQKPVAFTCLLRHLVTADYSHQQLCSALLSKGDT